MNKRSIKILKIYANTRDRSERLKTGNSVNRMVVKVIHSTQSQPGGRNGKHRIRTRIITGAPYRSCVLLYNKKCGCGSIVLDLITGRVAIIDCKMEVLKNDPLCNRFENQMVGCCPRGEWEAIRITRTGKFGCVYNNDDNRIFIRILTNYRF